MAHHQLNSRQLGALNIGIDQLEQSLRNLLQNSNTFYEFKDCSIGDQLVELPDPDTLLNAVTTYFIKKIDNSVNKIIISSLGTNKTIDGQVSISIDTQYDSYTLKSHNGQWYIV